MSSIYKIPYYSFAVLPSNEELTVSLKEMCKKYGLEELSPFIDDEPLMSVAETLRCVPGMCAPFIDQVRVQNGEYGLFGMDLRCFHKGLYLCENTGF